MTHDEPTPRGERRCRVGVGPDGEPIFEPFVRLSWHKAQLAGVVEQCAKVCEEIQRTAAECPETALYCAAAIRSLSPTEAKGEPVAQDVHQWESDLLHATSIGMATIIVRCGAYETLSPYLKTQYDDLARLHAKCDKAFSASPQPGAGKERPR